MGLLLDLEGDLLSELRARSQKRIYQRDPEAWLWDVLNKRWWSKQREVAHGPSSRNPFTLVKSANGVGKSQLAGRPHDVVRHRAPAEETVVMVSAPVRNQIDEVLFRYLRDNYSLAAARGHGFIGEITRWPKWKTDEPYDIDLVVPRRPSDANLLSAFQGVHNTHVAVVLDEAGGLQEDFYTGAYAVTTNEHARILGIGNPDRRNTPFHKRFQDRETYVDWVLFTIGAKDTPNFTGELLFPDDPELDAKAKAKMIQVEWVAMMRRSALPGVVAAKVDGEFPLENEDTFFAQSTIDRAHNAELEPEKGSPAPVPRRGRGLHRRRQVGGLPQHRRPHPAGRRVGQDAGVEYMDQARRIHRLCKDYEVDELRIDRAGTGVGVFSNLLGEREFADRRYTIIGVLGNNASPNRNEWLNARAWHYDTFRKGMSDGTIDLDPKDKDLTDDMLATSYEMTKRGQLQITSKAVLKSKGDPLPRPPRRRDLLGDRHDPVRAAGRDRRRPRRHGATRTRGTCCGASSGLPI
jgi:hypothetical protein